MAASLELKQFVDGFDRIGELTVWRHVARKHFDETVVNIGRQVGTSLADIAYYVERDSTYSRLHSYLYGHNGQPVVTKLEARETRLKNNGGSVLLSILLLMIPALIAIIFSLTYAYLLIINQSVTNYSPPDELRSSIVTIISYYFGIGAATVFTMRK